LRNRSIQVGAFPEASAFTPDGRYVVVSDHADQDFSILKVLREQADFHTRATIGSTSPKTLSDVWQKSHISADFEILIYKGDVREAPREYRLCR
jgi:hypothetical protein